MIDYDKLKLAHELAEKLSIYLEIQTRTLANHRLPADFCCKVVVDGDELEFYCFDDLITKLKELTQDKPKPKYGIGQEVWHLGDEFVPESGKVIDIDLSSDEMYLVEENNGDGVGWWVEERLYPSLENLLGAMVDYWGNLYCHHVGQTYDGINFMQPLFEGEAEGFLCRKNKEESTKNEDMSMTSSCCSVHTGTAEECHSEANPENTDINKEVQEGFLNGLRFLCGTATI